MDKICKKCGLPKYLKEFPKVKANCDGRGGKCKECEGARRRKREKINYWKDPEKKRKKCRDWHNNNRFKNSLYHSVDGGGKKCTATIDEVIAAFDGACAICGITEEEYGRKLHMDHCHESGQLRGFLCQKCNQGLGNYNDSVDLIIAAAEYLESFATN